MNHLTSSAFMLTALAFGLNACGDDGGGVDLAAGSGGANSGGATGTSLQNGQGLAGSSHSVGTPSTAAAGGSTAGKTTAATVPSSGGSTSSTETLPAVGGASTGTGGSTTPTECTAVPIDPEATAATKTLLCYLYSIYTKQVLSGQQEMPWDTAGRKALFDYTNTQTGKYPAIWGGDYLYTGEVAQARAYSTAGGIIMMRYHMGAPPLADTYENSKGTVTNFDNLTVAGTEENTSLNSKLDNMAKQLTELAVPVILVPYHEVDKGAWFWWSKGTGSQFQKLWKYTIEYINKTKGVHNVLWTLGFGHDGAMADYYPGKEFIDLGGIDEYDKGLQPFAKQWTSAKKVFGDTIPIPLHETGTIPQPSDMWTKGTTWLMWNVWCNYLNTDAEGYTWNTPETIKSAYADSHTISRADLPTNLK